MSSSRAAGRLGDDESLVVGEELVQWRVEEPDGDRQAVHRREDRGEVGLLHDVELVQDVALVGRVVAEDQPSDQPKAMLGEEHVLGSAEPDALGAEVSGVACVVGGVGVGANTHARRGSGRPSAAVSRVREAPGGWKRRPHPP